MRFNLRMQLRNDCMTAWAVSEEKERLDSRKKRVRDKKQ